MNQQLDKSEGDKHALDNFRCASDSVASGLQPARGRWSDPFIAGSSVGGLSHQLGKRPQRSVNARAPDASTV